MLEDLRREKQLAVSQSDQELAKQLWCLEAVWHIQHDYVRAFRLMQLRHFYQAWCLLEDVERALHSVERHLELNTYDRDQFMLSFIKLHTERFQSLFPYTFFNSPGMIVLEQQCSICGHVVSIRNSCGHLVGEIYNGKLCYHRVTRSDLVEMSVVRNPVQKYSVLFWNKSQDGRPVDTYNYFHVDYVVRRLRSAFVSWDVEKTTIERPRSDFKDVGRNEFCPCGSGDKFKVCCWRKKNITCRHHSITFSEHIPDNLPPYEADRYVQSEAAPIPIDTYSKLSKMSARDNNSGEYIVGRIL